jgi:uncharacterized phiE125 gp8 family phage protein
MPSVVVTQPASEPITLDEAKLHLRIESNTADDLFIASLITAARQKAESITRRAFISQTWKGVMDQFPRPAMNIGSANWYGPQWGTSPGPLTTLQLDGRTSYEIYLDHSPVASVVSIVYVDTTGFTQTLDPAAYKLDNVSEPCRIVPAYGTTWPDTRNEINAITVTYNCGYGAASSVPEGIKSWMKLRIGALYENREEIVVGQRITSIDLPFADRLLDDYRVLDY